MALNKVSYVVLALAAIATTGCMGNYPSNNPYPPANVGTFPPAATGTGTGAVADITQSDLPSPTDPYPTAPSMNGQIQATPSMNGQIQATPSMNGQIQATPSMNGQMQTAQSVNNNIALAGGINLAAASIAGVWNANIDGMTCKIATPMTKFGQGYRSAPMHCPTAISSANSWNINVSKLEFFDANGAVVAALTSQDGRSFNGQTASGSRISLSR